MVAQLRTDVLSDLPSGQDIPLVAAANTPATPSALDIEDLSRLAPVAQAVLLPGAQIALSAPKISLSTDSAPVTPTASMLDVVAFDVIANPMAASPMSGNLTFNNMQPYLAVTQLIALQGSFPPRDGFTSEGFNEAYGFLASIRTFAGNFAPQATASALGQVLGIANNTALFSLLGTTYGGNGQTTFALPDLAGTVAVGRGQGPGLYQRYLGETYGSENLNLNQGNLPASSGGSSQMFDNSQPSLALTYMIQVYGTYPSRDGFNDADLPLLGSIGLFAGNFAPRTMMECNGQLLSIAQNTALFSLLGTTYGGNGTTTFALPDLRGRTVVGASDSLSLGTRLGEGTPTISQGEMPTNMGGSGQPQTNMQPALALNYVIALEGYFPSQYSGYPDLEVSYVGEIMIVATNFAPLGYAFCHGQLMPISENTALFSLLGTMYGGDGITTFALPDFRGRVAVGSGTGDYGTTYNVGQTGGSANLSLTSADMPSLYFSGTESDNALFGGDIYDYIFGLGGNDAITGNQGSDYIDGGTGVDTMNGGLGNDTFMVDDSADVVTELNGQGTDSVFATASYSLAAINRFVENLTLTGSANLNATGNGLANTITGNTGNNILDGGTGNDTLTGGLGDDTFIVQNGDDSVVELNNEGTDTVQASVTYTLAAPSRFVENLTLTGGAHINATGNGLANRLVGNTGHNRLDGGTGNDTMSGGLGNDTYVVQSANDSVIELNGEGRDTILTSVTYTLVAPSRFVEDVTLTGTDDINITGNNLNNILTGNTGVNTLTGGVGNDTYFVQNLTDNVVEATGEGTDTINSTVTYTLAASGRFVENLTLTGTDNINATGNNLANVLIGNSGNNRLDGGRSQDTYTGGLGADIFVFGLVSGQDVITDFNATQNDSIDVSAYTSGVANTGLVTQSGLNVLITLGGGNIITVNNTNTGDVLMHMVW